MVNIADLPFWLREFLKVYPWRRIDPVPSARLMAPVSTARVALVSTAGLVPPGCPPFDEKAKGGDWTYRVISGDVHVQDLGEYHRSESFDHAGLARDRNLAMPLDRLRELADLGEIGCVAPRHLSFMGSITAPGRLIKDSAPEAAGLLAEDEVDIALLVPV